MKERKNYGRIDWESLELFACVDTIRDKIFKHKEIKRDETDMLTASQFRNQDLIIDEENYTQEELYRDAKHRYLTTLKGIYWEYFENGQCSSRACLLLIESADRGIDHNENALKDFTFIQTYFSGGWIMKLLMKLRNL